MSDFVIDFRTARSYTDLGNLIGCTVSSIERIVASPTRREFYFERRIPKINPRRKDQLRTVWEPIHPLNLINRALFRRLDAFVRNVDHRYPHPSVHGFVAKRSILTNAQQHLGKRYLLRTDIRRFFSSIPRTRIDHHLESLGIDRSICSAISAFLTVDDKLVEGLSTSPLMANLMCLPMDDQLRSLTLESDSCYTRYADDLTFSSNSEIPQVIKISEILEDHGFAIAPEETRRTTIGQAHFVTGLSVTDPLTPHIPRRLKKRLRQELYYIEKYGADDHAIHRGYRDVSMMVNKVDGQISYLQSIEPTLGSSIRQRWIDLLEAESLRPTHRFAEKRQLRDAMFLVDESILELNGEKYLIVGLTVSEAAERMRLEMSQLTQAILSNPFATGRKKNLEKKGLHFTDDTEETRTEVIKKIAEFPVRFFAAFSKISQEDEKQLFLKLFRHLLADRMTKYSNYFCNLSVENRSDIKEDDIKNAVEQAEREHLKKARRRRISRVSVKTF